MWQFHEETGNLHTISQLRLSFWDTFMCSCRLIWAAKHTKNGCWHARMLTVSHHHGTNPAISFSCKPSSSESGCFSQQHKQSVHSTSCKKIPHDQNSSNSWISNKEIAALNSEIPPDGISMYPLISKSFETVRYFRHSIPTWHCFHSLLALCWLCLQFCQEEAVRMNEITPHILIILWIWS